MGAPCLKPSSRRHDPLYKRATAPFLYTHPIPHSTIVHFSAKSKGARLSTPPDCDHHEVDSFTKNYYSVAAMLVNVHTFFSYMSAYVLSMSNKITALSQDQSSPALTQILPMAKEVSLVVKQHICSLQHTVSYTSRSLTNSIVQRLASTSLPPPLVPLYCLS